MSKIIRTEKKYEMMNFFEKEKKEYLTWLLETLTPEELVLIDYNFYHNPEFCDEYYTKYHLGYYDECRDFVITNRELLTIEHTPEKFKNKAKESLNSLKKQNLKNTFDKLEKTEFDEIKIQKAEEKNQRKMLRNLKNLKKL